MKIWSLPKHENLTTSKNIVEKWRDCSSGAISPFFHNVFDISLTTRVQLHINLLNVIVRIVFFFHQFWKSDMSRYGYLKVFQSPLEFEITRVDCIIRWKKKQHHLMHMFSQRPQVLRRKSYAHNIITLYSKFTSHRKIPRLKKKKKKKKKKNRKSEEK